MQLRERVRRHLYHLIRKKTFVADLPDAPHFDEQSTVFFRDHLMDASFYLEFGSGGSTVEAARLGKRTITVENDPQFARAIGRKIGRRSSVSLIVVDIGPLRKWGKPVFTDLTPRRRRSWARYSVAPYAKIDSYGGFPDFILIDGRFRCAVMLEIARQAHCRHASTTVMFDDYFTKRQERYSQVEQFVGTPTRIGRSAIFHIQDGHLAKVPTASDLEIANEDYE